MQGWGDIGGGGGPVRGDNLAAGWLASQHVAGTFPEVHSRILGAVNGCGPEEQWLRQFSGMRSASFLPDHV